MNELKKIRIGIIDSGIDPVFLQKHPVSLYSAAAFKVDFENKTLDIFKYDRDDIKDWDGEKNDLEIRDLSGHGTAILSIIYKKICHLFDINFSVAKILDEHNNSKSYCLVEALEWMVESAKPDFINMSLGAEHDANVDKLYELTKIAKEKGIKIFCSASGLKTYPAEFDTVTTVGDSDLFKHGSKETGVDKIITHDYVEVYNFGRWIKQKMFTSYACPIALSEYIKENNLSYVNEN